MKCLFFFVFFLFSVVWADVAMGISNKDFISASEIIKAEIVCVPVSITSKQEQIIDAIMAIKKAALYVESEGRNAKGIKVIIGGPELQPLVAAPSSKVARLDSVLTWSRNSSNDSPKVRIVLECAIGKDEDIYTGSTRIYTFLNGLKLAGDLELQADTPLLAIQDPEKYRAALLDKLSAQISMLKRKFGPTLKSTVTGIEEPIKVSQHGPKEVELWLPYSLSVEVK